MKPVANIKREPGRERVADPSHRKDQRYLASGVDVLGLLLASWVEVGLGCNTLKVDSTYLIFPPAILLGYSLPY